MPRGDYIRFGKAMTVEDVRQLDIRLLDKRSLCRPGTVSRITWKFDHHQLQFITGTDRLVLTNPSQTIYLSRTSCHYGGERLWFLCPNCNKRVAVLHELDENYLCRHCHRLPYSSQRGILYDRLLSKLRKLRKRLGAAHDIFQPVYDKPKGMHWKTFKWLVANERGVNLRVTREMVQRFDLFPDERV